MHRRTTVVLFAVMLLLLGSVSAFATSPAAMAALSSGGGEKAPAELTIPPGATAEQISEIMAGLPDEQVRSLLLTELRKEVATQQGPPEPAGVAGFVQVLRKKSAFIRDRFEYLFSGASTAPRELPKALSHILSGSSRLTPLQLVLALLGLSVLWALALKLFKKKTAPARKSIAGTPADAPWFTRMGRLFLRAMLDMFGVVIVCVVVFICYLTVFGQDTSGKPVIIAWLAAMIFLELIKVVSRFLLAPHAPTLRYLPLSDEVAQYLFKWVLRVGRVMAVGLLCTALIRLDGGSEALSLVVTSFFGFVVAFMLALLALWNKRRVAEGIRARHQPESLIYQFANVWHVGAITYVLGFWMFWVFALMVLGNKAMWPGIATLLIVPLYFLVDWATQGLVAFAVDMAQSSHEAQHSKTPDDAAPEEADVPVISKYQNFLSKGLKVLIFVAAFFLLLKVWGINFVIGREVVRAGINTLITLVMAYIFWIFISSFIERKLKDAAPDSQEESGEGGGGPGGDRFSTLLQLVKKFIFVAIAVITLLIVLSSLGVDVGPLIAGASVFGIAIGFGAQTLVKDIISGIFFLMDDAFRVGDYIIVGSAKGTVEEISVRSFKLRHHLGPLYTIPFGSVHEIQNMSRDWAIMKLQYLVPFDTDIAQVKKIIKEINKEVKAIPELREMMLDDIKSQGVKAMEEFGMRMRVKFKTKPGGQFTLRKLVLAKMRKKFEDAGIDFAKPRVTVHVPGDNDISDEEKQVAAAAAATTAMASNTPEGNASR